MKALTTRDIAGYCDVTAHAVNKWINAGKLKSYKTPGNHKKIDEQDFFEFLKKYDMPIPNEFQLRMRKKKRVLIVDDENTTVHLIKELLLKCDDYEVESASDGFEAGFKVTTFHPDLITLDLMMPNMNGFEACATLRKNFKNKDMKIIAVSAYLDEANKKQILDLGADDYLSKPFSSQDLIDKVRNLLVEKEV